jgi:hypothetical protein
VPALSVGCFGAALQISMHEFPQADLDAAASAHLGVQGALEHATPAMQRTLRGGVLNLRILRVGGWVGGRAGERVKGLQGGRAGLQGRAAGLSSCSVLAA